MAKYTDEQIKKMLEYCSKQGITSECTKCKLKAGDCRPALIGYALDLINRQEAEIERLNIELKAMRGAANSYKMHNEELETENRILSQKRMNIFEKCESFERGRVKGIKEFAERVKAFMKALRYADFNFDTNLRRKITTDDIDNLVAEMVGESKCTQEEK